MRLIKCFLLVLLCSGIVLHLIFILFRKGYNTYYTVEQTQLKEILHGKEFYDILFIGSSRTLYHVNPKIIDSVLNMKSYNAGIGGANILEMNMILKTYIASHPAPKYVVADLATTAFDLSERPIFNPNIYFPFLDNEIVFNTMKPYKRMNLLKYAPFLQLTEWDDDIKGGVLAGLVGKHKPLPPNYKGYIESGYDTIRLPFKSSFRKLYFEVGKDAIALFEELIEMCKKNHIKLIITYSPIYKYHDEKMNPSFFLTITEICTGTATPFLNYRYLDMNNDHRLFREEHHLNKNGADIFSNLLATDLMKIIAEDALEYPVLQHPALTGKKM